MRFEIRYHDTKDAYLYFAVTLLFICSCFPPHLECPLPPKPLGNYLRHSVVPPSFILLNFHIHIYRLFPYVLQFLVFFLPVNSEIYECILHPIHPCDFQHKHSAHGEKVFTELFYGTGRLMRQMEEMVLVALIGEAGESFVLSLRSQ